MATILTMRAIFERGSILKLLEEPEFKDNLHAGVIRSNRILSDHYFAVFVFASQPQEGGRLLLRVVSTTLVGIQQYTTTRLHDQGVRDAGGVETHLVAETLRAHFRAEQEDTAQRMMAAGSNARLPWIKDHFPNGAGDLSEPPEFVIKDLDFEGLERLFNEDFDDEV